MSHSKMFIPVFLWKSILCLFVMSLIVSVAGLSPREVEAVMTIRKEFVSPLPNLQRLDLEHTCTSQSYSYPCPSWVSSSRWIPGEVIVYVQTKCNEIPA